MNIIALLLLSLTLQQTQSSQAFKRDARSSQSGHRESSNVHLRPSSRLERDDVLGKWRLHETDLNDSDSKCPTEIYHKSLVILDNGNIGIRHGNIEQDGIQCQRGDAKTLIFYDSEDYTWDLQPRKVEPGDDVPPELDQTLIKTFAHSGPNNQTKTRLQQSGEHFYFGYERQDRFCSNNETGEATKLRERTTSFVVLPERNNIEDVYKLKTTLTVGNRWMIIVPRFARSACLYSPIDDSGDFDTSSGQRSCFPSEATVNLRDGRTIPMRDLQVGDVVATAAGKHSTVFGFTHRDGKTRSKFITLNFGKDGWIRASPGHMIYANGGEIKAMRDVHIGDAIWLVDSSIVHVSRMSYDWDVGLYNPQTLDGDIVVNGVLATTYTTAVRPDVAHSLLAPLRAWYRVCRMDVLAAVFNEKFGVRPTLVG